MGQNVAVCFYSLDNRLGEGGKGAANLLFHYAYKVIPVCHNGSFTFKKCNLLLHNNKLQGI